MLVRWLLVAAPFLVSCSGEPRGPAGVAPDGLAGARRGIAAPDLVPPATSVERGEPTGDEPQPAPLVDPLTVEGVVVDARSGRGFGGCLVRLTHAKRRFEARSDDAGHFALEIPRGEDRVRLWVDPRWTWRWRSDSPRDRLYGRPLAAEVRTGAVPLRIEVAERLARPIEGVAVDAQSGAPLPRFPFRLVHGTGREKGRVSLVTDEEGRFATEEPVRGGPVDVSAGRGEGWPAQQEVDVFHDGRPLTLAFHAGPRLVLRLTGEVPEDPTALSFAVLRRGQDRPCTETHLRVEPDGELWVRPPMPRAPIPPGETVSLFVMDVAGRRLGHRDAAWGDLSGFDEDAPLVLPVETTGALVVTAERSDEDARDLFDGWDRPRARIEMPELDFPGARWRLAAGRWLPAGVARVSADARSYDPVERLVEVVPDEVRAVRLRLDPAEGLRRVTGRVRAVSGATLREVDVHVALRDDPGARWWASYSRTRTCGTGLDHGPELELERDARVIRFAIDRVPPGDLAVSADADGGPCTVEVQGEPPGDVAIEVWVHDTEDTRGFDFRVMAAETGEPLDLWVAKTRLRDDGPAIEWGIDGPLGVGDPQERAFDWAVVARDRRTVYGTEHDFRPDGDGSSWADVSLERGWGTRLAVLGPGGDPISGAAVLVDGEEVGRTDREGRLELTAPECPRAIEVRTPAGEVIVHAPNNAPWVTLRARRD